MVVCGPSDWQRACMGMRDVVEAAPERSNLRRLQMSFLALPNTPS